MRAQMLEASLVFGSRNGVPSRKEYVVNGQMAETSNKSAPLPPLPLSRFARTPNV